MSAYSGAQLDGFNNNFDRYADSLNIRKVRTASVPASDAAWVAYVNQQQQFLSEINFQRLQSSVQTLAQISASQENWDGRGSAKPDDGAVRKSVELLQRIFEVSCILDETTPKPHVSADENGAITFEYWQQSRKLTIYVEDNEIHCLRIPPEGNIASIEEVEITEFCTDDFNKTFGWLKRYGG